MNGLNEHKRELGVRWIQAESGTTYLCPSGAFAGRTPTEDELKSTCVDESHNPQND